MKNIKCYSKTCKGRVIGYINSKGTPMAKETKTSGLLAVRMRNDGFLGFQCKCGNDSRVSRQEKGIVKYNGQAPTRTEMKEIYKRVKASPSQAKKEGEKVTIDNFSIEEA